MFHQLFATWMNLVHDWGYAGVFLLMALESTVFPIPSEIVVPPAAYWASRGEMNVWGVILASTLGSWFGSALSYAVARSLGRPLILRYGRYVFVPEKKWLLAEDWIRRYASAGIFFARLLPVVRHLVSLPAGAARMPFGKFSLMTVLGSGVWSCVLAWFGQQVLGSDPALMTDPDRLVHLLHEKLFWFVGAAALLLALYIAVDLIGRRLRAQAAGEAEVP